MRHNQFCDEGGAPLDFSFVGSRAHIFTLGRTFFSENWGMDVCVCVVCTMYVCPLSASVPLG